MHPLHPLQLQQIPKVAVFLLFTIILSTASFSRPGGASALEVSASEWELGMRWIGNYEEELVDADSSGNLLVTSFSFRLPLAFSGDSAFSLVPGISFYTLRYRRYGRDSDAERTVLSDIEWREVTAFVPLIDAGLRWDFYSGKSTHLAAETGMGFELPIPVKAWDDNDISEIIGKGYYGVGKYALPYFSLLAYWPLTNAYDVSTRLGGHFPGHRIWDGEDVPFYDHLMISLSVGMRFPKGERSVIEETEPPAPDGAPPL